MSSCRFPKLEECAHFHYESVRIGNLSVRLIDEIFDGLQFPLNEETKTASTQQLGSNCWFIMNISTDFTDKFLIKRSFDNIKLLDEMLHRCVFDRKISLLKNLYNVEPGSPNDIKIMMKDYFQRLSYIANDSITCGKILTWFQLDNKGQRLPLADKEIRRSINTPAVGAAYGVRKYIAQATDEISIDVGDMISVIDMPNLTESLWWRGKKNYLQKSKYEVGFFPQNCVATIGDKIPRKMPLLKPVLSNLNEETSPTKPVLQKHGKLISFFRSFILSRPSRRRLKQRGIYRERVFSCDLSEHLLNSGQNIPIILKVCSEFLEKNGIIDGIYRLSGITSNIQSLRRAFDEERIPDLTGPVMSKDIHAISSVLKMYFRELPNPLCTYQLYDDFVEAIQKKDDDNERLGLMRKTVLMLPPPHYRTLKYLAMHLHSISKHSNQTGMTDKNLAIVWAPNLLRSPAIESGGITALRGVGIQAVVTEYLIKNYVRIFEILEKNQSQEVYEINKNFASISCDHHNGSSCFAFEKCKYLTPSPPCLLSLEEAQVRQIKSVDARNSSPLKNFETFIRPPKIFNRSSRNFLKKHHTLLLRPTSWNKRKTASWKSLFSKNIKSSYSNQDIKYFHPSAKDIDEDKEEFCIKRSDVYKAKSISSQINCFKSSVLKKTPIEFLVRSNSIDSINTLQCHSRSISHDSYFSNLMQSPILNNKNICCKEFSELVFNFDREEPEIRIFSESESLLSSPKDPFQSDLKINIDHMLSESESFPNDILKTDLQINMNNMPSSSLVSVNQSSNHCFNEISVQFNLNNHISDLDFIDSYNTSYEKSSEFSSNINLKKTFNATECNKKKDDRSFSFQDLKSNYIKKIDTSSRYSYPNLMLNFMSDMKNHIDDTCMHYSENTAKSEKRIDKCFLRKDSMSQSQSLVQFLVDGDKQLNNGIRNRSYSSDTISNKNQNKCSKMVDVYNRSVTSLSSCQSPLYSLLLINNYSDPSSTVNTPVANVNFLKKINEENVEFIKEQIEIKTNLESQQKTSTAEKEISKTKLTLNLYSSACGSDLLLYSTDINNCNKVNATSDNTSQSLTPSEFGYLNFTRLSNTESSENSPIIENIGYVEEFSDQISEVTKEVHSSYEDVRNLNMSQVQVKQDNLKHKKICLKKITKNRITSLDEQNEEILNQKYVLKESLFLKGNINSDLKTFEILTESNNSNKNKETFSINVKEIANKFEYCNEMTHILGENMKSKKCENNVTNETDLPKKNFLSSNSLDESVFNTCVSKNENMPYTSNNLNYSMSKSVQISKPKSLNLPKVLPNKFRGSFTCDVGAITVQQQQTEDVFSSASSVNEVSANANILNHKIVTKTDYSLLSTVKLDRRRIEKIKEDRRHQLNVKHSVDTLLLESVKHSDELTKQVNGRNNKINVKSGNPKVTVSLDVFPSQTSTNINSLQKKKKFKHM